MTLTIKDSPELTGMAKPGSTAQNTENANGQSPRSNPVCLEVPVAIRSLPGEKSNGAGANGPMREEGRSVIVFDNGGVLRMTNPLPPGQTVSLSNHHGRDVVCRFVGGRNLPNIKGYIEVEFIEPVNDFWQIHPPAEPARVPSPEEPEASSAAVQESPAAAAPEAVPTALEPLAATPLAAAPPEPSPAALTPPPVAQVAAPVVAAPPPPPPAVPAKESSARTSSGAPTFEDIAGLVRMPPTAGPQAKKLEKKYEKKSDPAGAPSSMAARDGSQQSLQEIAKVNPPTRPASSIFEIDPELAAVPASSTEVFASPAPAPAASQPISNDFAGRGEQVSVPMTFASSSGSSEPRRRMPLVFGG